VALTPDFEAFAASWLQREAAEQPQDICVARTLIADMLTPVSAYQALRDPAEVSMIFESVEGGLSRGRYSIIVGNPLSVWRLKQGVVDGGEPAGKPDVLASLRRFIQSAKAAVPPNLPAFAQGVFGYLGHDLIRCVEDLPRLKPQQLDMADGVLIKPATLLIFDHVYDRLTLVQRVIPQSGETAAAGYARANALIQGVVDRLLAAKPDLPDEVAAGSSSPAKHAVTSNFPDGHYQKLVTEVKELIAAGEVYQLVPTQIFSRPFAGSGWQLYRQLRRLNPSPFLFCLEFPELAVVGSSPEILVRVRNHQVTVRPLAGTRPRGADDARDQQLAQELLADPKDRSEHLMLLDLGRNDVGRVAKIGSVTVTEQFVIERYSHVMHLVSNVTGQLLADKDAVDAVLAGFPAGTVTGAPKIRAMQLLDELEPTARNLYGGLIGYFTADHQADTCIAIRTGLVKDGQLYVQAGAGLVADSDPESEHQECVNKARALLAAADAVDLAG
jgi:anthranilate synthase component 1